MLVMLLLCMFCTACAGQAAEEEGNASKEERVRFVYDVRDYQTMYDIMDEFVKDLHHSFKLADEEGPGAIPHTLWVVNSEKGECFYVDLAVAFQLVPRAPAVRTRAGIFVFDNDAFYWLDGEDRLEIPARCPELTTAERIEWKHFDAWMEKIAVQDKAAGIQTSVSACFAPTFRHKENWERMRAFFLKFPQREWGMGLYRVPVTYEELLRRIKPTPAATTPAEPPQAPTKPQQNPQA